MNAVNVEAAERMAKLHDALRATGYSGHQLEVYLVRLLFCLFSDDTDIFEPGSFQKYIVQRTNPDGSDLALHIGKIFETLNKPPEKRLKTIDEQLNKFPLINGGLFEEQLETADFDSTMRNALLDCCDLDWSKISPAIFGAMFQSVMNIDERHNLGAHYTSEENILKVIHPLFLDTLWDEFDRICRLKSSIRQKRLNEFHDKLSSLKFLDPACGCGNFLVIAYRELRILELAVLEELFIKKNKQKVLDISQYIKVSIDQFYGIEIEEFPGQIALTALWLTDHQMNLVAGARFGQYFVRIPLNVSASIHFANTFDVSWENVVSKKELHYILGNPPFLGARVMNERQKKELVKEFGGMKNCNNLDYVTAWYRKTAQYIQGTQIEVGFVSTNSICQGSQAFILWRELMSRFGIKINFAHQTFKWSNEARGNAMVCCVIIGFSLFERKEKRLFLYNDLRGKAKEVNVKRINNYLIDAEDIFLENRKTPICEVPKMVFGNMPNDGGNFLFTEEEKDKFLAKEPQAEPYIKPLVSADEFINGKKRYCLWLADAAPDELKKMPYILKRIEAVKKMRQQSPRRATQLLADQPALFGEIRQPNSHYLLIPRVSSERRKFIPIGFFDSHFIAGDTCMIIPDASLYHFGILTSTMHMAWMRYVCGRLEIDYRYSASIVYNNFPWSDNVTATLKKQIESAAQKVLDVRTRFPKSSLADLYDPLTMPQELAKAHQTLDKLAERAYGRSFVDDSDRVSFLFERYQQITSGLLTKKKNK
jgi:type II restriction/modification system DNA methylase subunit YeeA